MKKGVVVLLLLVVLALHILPETQKEIPEIPMRFDFYPGGFTFVRVPFTLGGPLDFGFGLTDQSPVGGVFLFGSESRYKQLLLNRQQLAEQKRMRLFLGIGNEFYYEVDFQYYFFDTIDFTDLLEPILGYPISYLASTRNISHFRFFGRASDPRFIGESSINMIMGPFRLDLDSYTHFSLDRFESLTELGIKWMGYKPFGVVMGEMWGVFGDINIGNRHSRVQPRFLIGWMPEPSHLGFGFTFHDERPTPFGLLKINGALLLGFDGGGYWRFQGEYVLTNTNSVLFSLSSKNVYLGGRMIIPLGFPQ